MKKLLLSGFEPFLQFPINPTEQIIKSLDGEHIGDYVIKGILLPVDFGNSSKLLIEEMEKEKTDAVVSIGLAGGRNCITPERVAINCRDGAEDNEGNQYQDAPIIEGGPAAYFSTLPIRKIVNVLKENHIPAEISNSAGTYLCNDIMYSVLYYLEKNQIDIPAGFIHVPANHKLAAQSKRPLPSWSDQDLTHAIRLAIQCL